MALPSSGNIDLDQIYDEAVSGGYSGGKDLASLATWPGWSSGPNGSLPHEMTEFYGGGIASIVQLGNAYEFSTPENFSNKAVLVDQNRVWHFWDLGNVPGHSQIFQINTSNGSINTIGTPAQFAINSPSQMSPVLVNSNHAVNFWFDSGSTWGQVFRLNNTTNAVSVLNSALQIHNVGRGWNGACKIDSSHVINFWEGTNYSHSSNRGGFCQIFNINTSTGVISPLGTMLDFNPEYTMANTSFQVNSNHVMNFWTGQSVIHGFCQIFETNTSTGAITPKGSAFEFDANTVDNHSAFQVDSTHVINFWRRGAATCLCQMFQINSSTGVITPMGTPLQFANSSRSTGYGSVIEAFLVSSDKAMCFWSEYHDSYCQLFDLDVQSGTINPLSSPVKFEEYSSENSSLKIDQNHVMNFWRGGSGEIENDGYCRVFEVNY